MVLLFSIQLSCIHGVLTYTHPHKFFTFIFLSVFFWWRKADRPTPEHMRRLITCQVFCQVERRFHNRESNRQPRPWDLGISRPSSSSSLGSSRTHTSHLALQRKFHTPRQFNTCFHINSPVDWPPSKLQPYIMHLSLSCKEISRVQVNQVQRQITTWPATNYASPYRSRPTVVYKWNKVQQQQQHDLTDIILATPAKRSAVYKWIKRNNDDDNVT